MSDAIALEVFRHRCSAIAEEMGAALERSAFSSNIQERRDYSCALFDAHGYMVAQAAHIPVHLGAMPHSVAAALLHFGSLADGDVVILNDPHAGGTHLPDFTTVAPIYVAGELMGYSATRAHHADVGGMAPGSMPLSQSVFQEGLILPPVKIVEAGVVNRGVVAIIARNSRTSAERSGDLQAQFACHAIATRRMESLCMRMGCGTVHDMMAQLISYGERRMRALIRTIPDGIYQASDVLDDDGVHPEPLTIAVTLTVHDDELSIDFTGTAVACRGPLNAPRAVTESAVLYALRTLDGDDMPASAGAFRPLHWTIPAGSLLNPPAGVAVAGGNVETSQRIVDVMYRALAHALPTHIPAQSAGTMNNWTMGGVTSTGQPFAYYETLGGGMGARPSAPGLSGVQTHMTNTRNTPIEMFERLYPVRVHTLAVRRGSGGAGVMCGGDGICKDIEFLVPTTISLLTERRTVAPAGYAGGADGASGVNTITFPDGLTRYAGKGTFDVPAGSHLHIATPGGGGFGGDV